MLKPWKLDGYEGDIQYPEGEVVTQTQGVVVMPIYVGYHGVYFIEVDGKLQKVVKNPFNGYCYRQDGL